MMSIWSGVMRGCKQMRGYDETRLTTLASSWNKLVMGIPSKPRKVLV